MPDDETDPQAMTRQQELQQELQERLGLLKMRARSLVQRHGRLAIGVTITALAAFGLGMMVYRGRSRQSLVRRLHGALPGSVRELPEDLLQRLQGALPGSIRELPEELLEQLKRPIKRAARNL